MIIVLYVMDSLRPDFLSCYGHGKETSPAIDRLAQEGVLFTHAFSQSTWTKPAGASLLSSAYPSVHGVQTLLDGLPGSVPLLPEQLKRKGFRTVAISAIPNISPAYGFGRGFDRFIELYKQEPVIQRRKVLTASHLPVSTSEEINHFLFPLLEEAKGTDLFALVWSMDTHNPFFHRDRSLARFSEDSGQVLWSKDISVKQLPEQEVQHYTALYEDMIYFNDVHIGRLIQQLKALDLFDETFFILTSDHGESLGEHGVNSHMGVPYEHQIRVPLVMKFPRSDFHGTVSGLVQHIDIVPTLLDFWQWPLAHPFQQGRSVLPLIRDGGDVHEQVFAEYQLKEQLPRYVALRTKTHKYMEIRPGRWTFPVPYREIRQRLIWQVAKPRLLFDLDQDPGEKVNIVNQKKQVAEDLHSRVKEFLKKNGEAARTIKREKIDLEEVDEACGKQLKALGYFD
jgi:arylsulfatase A-like enzyme